MKSRQTHFGYQRVAASEKARRVGAVFDSVAGRYDLMNDLMSLGTHRLWKRYTVAVCAARAGDAVLDVAGGTGDLALHFARRVGCDGRVVLADINSAMLERGRCRLLDAGMVASIALVRADAQALPFADGSFDQVCIGFGLRNVTDKSAALASMYRVLRPGGQLAVLEFSRLGVAALRPLYDAYSFKVLPLLGRAVAGDADSYRYLAESIRMHPDQDALQRMMEQAGFARCSYDNLAAGIVALHRGYKL